MAHTFLANPKGHGGAGAGFQVMVHVGQDPLADDGVFAATLEDGTHLSAEALRRVTCRFPGCTHHQFFHGHHIQHWLHGGETSVDNLVMLCSHHHHLVHEGGFTLTWSTEGQLIFSAPDGQVLNAEAPAPITLDVLVWLREWTHECGPHRRYWQIPRRQSHSLFRDRR